MKRERHLTFPQLLGVLLIGGGLYLFFGIHGLTLWARNQASPWSRTLFTTLLKPVETLAQRAEVLEPAAQAKASFHTLKEIPFPRPARETAVQTALAPSAREGAYSDGPTERPSPESTEAAPRGGVISIASAGRTVETAPPAPREETPPPPERVNTVPDPSPRGVLLIGDSLANSTATALVPLVEEVPDLWVRKHGKVSSNLANPVFVDWFTELDILLAENSYHTVILMLGANAAQRITLGEEEYPWDSPEWNRIYRERARKLIQKLSPRVERIVWVGIPPMLKRGYRERMIRQNEIIKEICETNGIVFLSLEEVMGNEEGLYTDYKTIDGRQVKLRLSDTIHYTRQGATHLSRYLLTELYPELYPEEAAGPGA